MKILLLDGWCLAMWNKKLFCVQLKRVFGGWLFRISCLLSVVIIACQTYTNLSPIYLEGWAGGPITMYSRWVGNDIGSFSASLFYYVMPLLAMLPFGIQYILDMRNGYLKNLMIRVPARQVIVSYGVCNFIGAFLSSLFPYFLSLYVNALLYPSLIPEPSSLQYAVSSASLFGDLFYTHPLVYCILYSVISALYPALLALVGMGISFYLKNIFLSLVFPFLFNFLVSYLALTLHMSFLSPLHIFQPTQQVVGSPAVILGWYGICLIAAAILFWRHMNQYELY